MQVNDNDHFGNQIAVYQAYFKKEWSNIGKKVNKDEWYMNPHEVNAYYSPNFNKVRSRKIHDFFFYSSFLFTLPKKKRSLFPLVFFNHRFIIQNYPATLTMVELVQ
jgi:hypothetical protein